MPIKSGFKTTEFYMTLIPTFVSMLVLAGFIPVEGQTQVLEMVKDAVAGIVAIVGIVSYITGRTEVKKAYINREDPKTLG